MKNIARATRRLGRFAANLIKAPLVVLLLRRRYGAHRPDFRAVRRVAVFPSLGLAYNRVKKNANTSTIILLRELEVGRVEERNEAKWNARNLFDLSLAELRALDRLQVFVVTRNPYSRVLSAFLDKFRAEGYRRRHGAFPLTPEGFHDFVVWLGRGGMRKDAHWDLQTRLMFLPLAAYDTVIRFEDFREGTLAMLRARGIAPPGGSLEDLYASDQSKRTSSSAKLEQFYTPELAAMVARLYAKDFDALGYSRDFPGAADNSAHAPASDRTA